MTNFELKRILNRVNTRLTELWKLKFFRYSIILHFFYFIFSSIITLLVLRSTSDFYVYYRVGEIFVNDPNNLYNPANYVDIWPFRYFPLSAMMFVPYYLMGFDLGFIIFNFINLILNVLISIILYKIIIIVRGIDHEMEDKRIILYICLYLIGLPQLFNYILGQINLYVTLLILISLFIFIKKSDIKWQFIASVILGISIIIKPTTLFMIPFIIVIGYNYEKRKLTLNLTKSLVRLIGVILPVALNLIMFLGHPNLLNGFLATNFTGSETVLLNHSFSITKIISNMFLYFGVPSDKMSVLPIFLGVLLIIGVLGFIFYVFRRSHVNEWIFGYLFGILVMFLAYFDTWDHHILQITPLLILALFSLPRNSELTRKYIKPGFFFLNFFGLVFTGIFWLLMLTIGPFFPFNFASTLFLILIFIGVSQYCLKKQNAGAN
jgi:hypothetical protein